PEAQHAPFRRPSRWLDHRPHRHPQLLLPPPTRHSSDLHLEAIAILSCGLQVAAPLLSGKGRLWLAINQELNSEPDARLLRLARPAADPLLRQDVNPKFDVALPAHCSRIQPIRHGAQKAPWA